MWMTWCLIALGGALGSVARFGLAGWIEGQAGGRFPWGTLAVNVIGSFAIGFFAALTGPEGRWPLGLPARQFFMAGVCGGFTTFSAFSAQTFTLINSGDWPRAGGNVLASVALCLFAVWLGHSTAVALNSLRSQ